MADTSLPHSGPLPTNDISAVVPQTDAAWGITDVLSSGHVILQNVDISEERITDTTQDQTGAVVSQLDYDKHWTLDITFIGPRSFNPAPINAAPGSVTFLFRDHNWKVLTLTETGAYNDKVKFNLTAERWNNYPAQPAHT